MTGCGEEGLLAVPGYDIAPPPGVGDMAQSTPGAVPGPDAVRHREDLNSLPFSRLNEPAFGGIAPRLKRISFLVRSSICREKDSYSPR